MTILTRAFMLATLTIFTAGSERLLANGGPNDETPESKLTGAVVKSQCADLVLKFKNHVKPNGPFTTEMYQSLVSITEEVKTNLPDGELDSDNRKVMQGLLAVWTSAQNSDDGMNALIAWLVANDKRLMNARSNLKQIALAIAMYADDHQGMMPPSLDVLVGNTLSTDKVLTDPLSGKRFVYVGQGMKWSDEINLDLIVAYSPIDYDGREVLFNDGSVRHLSSDAFIKILERQTKTAK